VWSQVNYNADIISSSTQVKKFLPDGTVSQSSQVDITQTTNYTSFSSSIATKNDTQDVSINSLNAATSSYAINSTIQSQLAGVVSSSTQVAPLLPNGTVSSSAFTSPNQGTVRATINGVQTDVDTGLQIGDTPLFAGFTVSGSSKLFGKVDVINQATANTSMSVVAGVVPGYIQFNATPDIVYYDFSNAQIVANVGLITPGDIVVRGVVKNDNGAALNITGGTSNKTVVSGSLHTSGSFDAFIVSASTALTASHVQLKNLTDTTTTNKVLVLDTVTHKIFTTASVGGGGGGQGAGFPFSGSAVITGSLLVSGSGLVFETSGSAAIRDNFRVNGSTLFVDSTTNSVIAPNITGSIFSGSVMGVSELTLAVSGTITATGTTTVLLDLNHNNFFSVSGSGAGTVTWQVTNPPDVGRVQTFVIEYTNGGIKTNNWFTNTRWPAGSAPILTTGTAPDMLSFTSDDNGANWRGLLLQRGSA
jgi:hypothetical protein